MILIACICRTRFSQEHLSSRGMFLRLLNNLSFTADAEHTKIWPSVLPRLAAPGASRQLLSSCWVPQGIAPCSYGVPHPAPSPSLCRVPGAGIPLRAAPSPGSIPLANREVRGEHLLPGRKVLDRGTPEHPLLAKTPAPDLVICSAWCFAPRAMARGCSAPRISPPVPIRSGYGGPGCAHGVRSASALWKEPSTRAAFLCSPPSGFAWQWGDREATCPVLCVSLFLQASLPNSLLIPARAAPLSAALRCSPSMQGRKCQQGNDSAIVQGLKYGNPV